MSNLIIDLGRILLGLSFAVSAVIDYRLKDDLAKMLATNNIPKISIVLPCAIALKLIGGLLITFNFLTVFAAIALAIFTLIANCIFHAFWKMEGKKREIEFSQFLAHVGVIGGFLLLIAATM